MTPNSCFEFRNNKNGFTRRKVHLLDVQQLAASVMVAVGKTGQEKNILTLTRLQAPVPREEHTIPDLTWSSET